MIIPFHRSTFNQEEVKAVRAVIKSGWLTMGKKTLEFEKKLAEYVGAPYVIAVNSGTSALFLAIKAFLRKNKIKKITIPSFTFSATAAVCLHNGLDIEFGDIDKKTFNLKPTNNWSIPVHYAGLYCHQKKVVVEDSAHRIMKNSFCGNLTAYSFYVTKNISTGEGGALATGDKETAQWLKQARLHGLSADAWKRYQKKGDWQYQVEFPGWKMNMTDLQAALGLVQLKKLPEMHQKRKRLVKRYNRWLGGIDREANHLYPVLVNKRAQFIEYMKKNGVSCKVHYLPLHLQPAYQKWKKKLPNTEYVGKRVVTLPLYPDLNFKEVDLISKLVLKWKKKNG